MIYDGIANYVRCTLPALFREALEHSLTLNAETPEGRILLRGDDLYAGVSEYNTIPEDKGKYETHRKYADIQIMLSGCERIMCRPAEGLVVSEPYDAVRDVAFYGRGEKPGMCEIVLAPGAFAVFFPWDAHMPQIASRDGGMRVKKVVYKVGVNAYEQQR